MSIDQDMAATVAALTRHFTRRWWWADPDDVRQTAWLAALSVRSRFDPAKSKTGNIRPLVRAAGARQVEDSLVFAGAPVSASYGRRYRLVGLLRAPVERVDDGHSVPSGEDALVAWEEERALVRRRLRLRARLHALGLTAEVLDAMLAARPGKWRVRERRAAATLRAAYPDARSVLP